MKMLRMGIVCALLASLCAAGTVRAQEAELRLSLSRDWGYGGFGGDIQGTFSMRVSGPENLVRVEFYLDDMRIGELTEAPFHLQFVTDDYPLGTHTLSSVGYTADGSTLHSNTLQREFVSPEAAGQFLVSFLVPVLALVFGAMILAAVVPLLLGRRTVSLPPGAARSYRLGGGICPKCKRPFGFHLYGLRLIAARFDRCPYCGKWSFVRYAGSDALRTAEKAEKESAPEPAPAEDAERKLEKEIDDSKYQSL